MTTQSFVRPGERVPDPETGGGKIKLEAPIVAPIPIPRSIWGIVLPIGLLVGIVGLIVVMYASGLRQLAGGFGLFGGMAGISAIGLVVRNRGAGRKMSFGELLGRRRKWFSRLDEVRDEVDVQRHRQWLQRRHFHWDPRDLFGVAGSVRMWDREPGEPMFAVVRLGVGKVKLAMTLEKPEIARAADLEPATGHALRKFLNAQEYVDNVPKVIWLQRFPGVSFVGDVAEARSLTRAVLCQLAAFHSPAVLQIIVVSSGMQQWDWVKWLPHVQHESRRDGCGERRMVFSAPADLEAFFDEQFDEARAAWTPPTSGVSAGLQSAQPLRVIVDDGCGSPEDWAGLTGATGYASTCFIRLAAQLPPRPLIAAAGAARYWVGFTPETTYRINGGVLRKQVPSDTRERVAQALYEGSTASDELDDAFYATADQMSVEDAELFARGLARYRAPGSASVRIAAATTEERTQLDVLGIRDPRHLDTDRLWAATRAQGPAWMRFPVGLYSDTGEVAELNLREGSQGGMGMHSLFIGTTGAGKSEGLITSVAGACLTHSPEVLNIVFTDFKLRSAAGMISRFPHVVAAVSNLAEERHLVGRLYDALDGELDRRGKIIADLDDCPDITAYNQRRLLDPSLPPIPALWVITDEYNEVFADPIWGPKFRRLYLRIARVGRSLHVFLQLVGQTKDVQNLRDINKLLGFSIAARTGTEEESRAVIGSNAAAKNIAPDGEEGTAYLRVALREPRKFRFFYSSADFVPESADAGPASAPQRAASEFVPRVFIAGEAEDVDNRLTAPPQSESVDAAPEPLTPSEKPFKLVSAITESLQAAKERPPRSVWLPVLGDPTPADELVARWRGRPWFEDYGNNAGLMLPVALADYPRGARQEVYCLDVLNDNALVVAAPGRGATTTVMTMVTTGALLYRPERVQFYCIAASGPQLARVADLPHVASVVAVSDAEGVSRMVATLEGIVLERDKVFSTRGLDMDKVRAAKFGPNPVDIGVAGGEVVFVVDGWKNFTDGYPGLVDRVLALQRARNFGVRVIITHTSSLSGLQSSVKSETGQRLELKLVNEHDTEVKRDPRDPERNPVREVPDRPGRGLTRDGHHLMVGAPVLADPPQLDGQVAGGPVDGDALSEVVRRVSRVHKATTVVRLPESVPLEEVFAKAGALPSGVVAFGLAESTLGAATIDFVDHPHVVATGLAGSGLTGWVRAMMRGIMRAYRSDAATIILIDPRRTSVGVVPQDSWLAAYAQTPRAITAVIDELCTILEDRRPPPNTSQHDLATKRFWQGREFFVVIDGITTWSHAASPLANLAQYVDEGDDLGLHIVAGADIRTFSYQSQGGVLGRMMNMQAPVVIMDGHRANGAIVPGVYATPQRPGKGVLWTRRGTDGVLVGWSEPPVISRRR